MRAACHGTRGRRSDSRIGLGIALLAPRAMSIAAARAHQRHHPPSTRELSLCEYGEARPHGLSIEHHRLARGLAVGGVKVRAHQRRHHARKEPEHPALSHSLAGGGLLRGHACTRLAVRCRGHEGHIRWAHALHELVHRALLEAPQAYEPLYALSERAPRGTALGSEQARGARHVQQARPHEGCDRARRRLSGRQGVDLRCELRMRMRVDAARRARPPAAHIWLLRVEFDLARARCGRWRAGRLLCGHRPGRLAAPRPVRRTFLLRPLRLRSSLLLPPAPLETLGQRAVGPQQARTWTGGRAARERRQCSRRAAMGARNALG
mmetsp:Transcript_5373/g.21186  ORF Transcript_5373/g.21186 Transcript_5373/m.21186 type:complete len:322 (-) Transcript_5373:1428-2393(-)